jgi:hypothetical protein
MGLQQALGVEKVGVDGLRVERQRLPQELLGGGNEHEQSCDLAPKAPWSAMVGAVDESRLKGHARADSASRRRSLPRLA